MTILLIEDEPLIARQLHKLVSQLEPEAVIDGPIASVNGICEYFTNGRTPDLVIADIQLSDGVSFDAFQQVGLSAPVIFTTAYDEYAIRAFKLNSIDYLLKPIDPDELRQALAKYHRWASNGVSDFSEQFRQFLAHMASPTTAPPYKRRFSGHYLRQIVTVPQEQIAYFLRNELIYLFTTEGKKLITDYKTLDELEEVVDPAHFFRANRQCLVHMNAIEGYRPQDNSKLLVVLKSPNESLELLVSKEKAGAFKHWLES
ncbi:LytR/AlgR family response regulator transcription factor [Spirosoma fluviale]|uniref:Two component transcriptional regulator, LytTR family n=1 Tax=Spirosoma fluviale TaxID=1597977 RepID=A0A286FEN4_9BACT|nr:LytTR family DNA-binding domain-containing protein [Spirosoma fluviale]SOD81705.1 two component transcriptional regulator, LytTR family [Spirosoma fluviale]